MPTARPSEKAGQVIPRHGAKSQALADLQRGHTGQRHQDEHAGRSAAMQAERQGQRERQQQASIRAAERGASVHRRMKQTTHHRPRQPIRGGIDLSATQPPPHAREREVRQRQRYRAD
jgi:Cu/Zn superoxide dismutase